MKEKIVSVIIPTYNRSAYLLEAIESVISQTYKNIEIIVIDDGSSDDTKEKLRPYLNKIKYVFIENGGPARARNVGMEMASGEYIAFLDSDDLYYPYKIEIQVAILNKHHGVSLVCSELSAINDTKILDELHLQKYHRSAYIDTEATYENIYSKTISIAESGLNLKKWKDRKIYIGDVFHRYYSELILSTNTVMFRKSLLKSVGLQREQYRLFEDYDFVLRITKSHRVAFIDVPTYKLRYHGTQISSTRDKPDGSEILIKKHINLIEIAERHGLDDKHYYSQNKAAVDRKLGGLNKALAITLMKTGENTQRARKYLRGCARHNNPERLLWLLTLAPFILRKISFKVGSMLDVINPNFS
jgi:glycosyltransferase involved in cell wall biosynthesis